MKNRFFNISTDPDQMDHRRLYILLGILAAILFLTAFAYWYPGVD